MCNKNIIVNRRKIDALLLKRKNFIVSRFLAYSHPDSAINDYIEGRMKGCGGCTLIEISKNPFIEMFICCEAVISPANSHMYVTRSDSVAFFAIYITIIPIAWYFFYFIHIRT